MNFLGKDDVPGAGGNPPVCHLQETAGQIADVCSVVIINSVHVELRFQYLFQVCFKIHLSAVQFVDIGPDSSALLSAVRSDSRMAYQMTLSRPAEK